MAATILEVILKELGLAGKAIYSCHNIIIKDIELSQLELYIACLHVHTKVYCWETAMAMQPKIIASFDLLWWKSVHQQDLEFL